MVVASAVNKPPILSLLWMWYSAVTEGNPDCTDRDINLLSGQASKQCCSLWSEKKGHRGAALKRGKVCGSWSGSRLSYSSRLLLPLWEHANEKKSTQASPFCPWKLRSSSFFSLGGTQSFGRSRLIGVFVLTSCKPPKQSLNLITNHLLTVFSALWRNKAKCWDR